MIRDQQRRMYGGGAGGDGGRGPSGFRPWQLVVAGLLGIVGLIALFSIWGAFESGDTGKVGVIRDGGPFDAKTFRGILPPAAGPTWIGFNSTVRYYPATERYDNIVPHPWGEDPSRYDSLDADAYRTNTKDGVNIGVKGQFKYLLNQDEKVLSRFDNDYGQRTYPVPNSPESERVAVSDDDKGFAVFIAGQARPLEEETLRQVIADYNCPDYDASCAVLKAANSGDPAEVDKAIAAAPPNSQTFQEVSEKISALMELKLKGGDKDGVKYTPALGAEYLTGVRFVFQAVDLPPQARDVINRVQTAGAGAAQARADAAKATAEAQGRSAVAAADAQANVEKQRGYNACTTCAQKELVAAQGEALSRIPAGSFQVYIPGGGQNPLSLLLPSGK